MCEQLSEVRQAMIAYATGFDADLLSSGDAAAAVAEAAAIEHAAATVKALAAVRATEAETWKAKGHRSAEEELARSTGTSVADARDALERGRRLRSQPDIAAAARRGELSPAQASAISDAAAADPEAGAGLLGAVQARGSLADLKNKCAQVKAAAVDLEARRRAIQRRRYLRVWSDPDGGTHGQFYGNPEDVAQVMSAVAPHAQTAFEDARAAGRHEQSGAYLFDGLIALAAATAATDPPPTATDTDTGDTKTARRQRPRRRGAPMKLLVRVDLETLMRGFPVAGETCELVGYGPIAVSAVNKLIADGDPFVAAILTKGKQLIGVAHLGRHPTSWQRSALEWLYPTCAAEGCPAPGYHLQTDHRIDWAKTKITLLDWLDNLCDHCHDKKTRHDWSLVDGHGKRPLVPPTDPRHPRHNRHQSDTPLAATA